MLLSQTLTTMSADARRPVRPLQPRRAHRRPREAAVTVCFSAAALAADSGCVQRLALAASSPSSPTPMSTVGSSASARTSPGAPRLRPWLARHHPRRRPASTGWLPCVRSDLLWCSSAQAQAASSSSSPVLTLWLCPPAIGILIVILTRAPRFVDSVLQFSIFRHPKQDQSYDKCSHKSSENSRFR